MKNIALWSYWPFPFSFIAAASKAERQFSNARLRPAPLDSVTVVLFSPQRVLTPGAPCSARDLFSGKDNVYVSLCYWNRLRKSWHVWLRTTRVLEAHQKRTWGSPVALDGSIQIIRPTLVIVFDNANSSLSLRRLIRGEVSSLPTPTGFFCVFFFRSFPPLWLQSIAIYEMACWLCSYVFGLSVNRQCCNFTGCESWKRVSWSWGFGWAFYWGLILLYSRSHTFGIRTSVVLRALVLGFWSPLLHYLKRVHFRTPN